MASGLTTYDAEQHRHLNIQTRSQKRGNFILKGEERGDACRRAKDEANVKVKINSTAKTCNLSANLKGV